MNKIKTEDVKNFWEKNPLCSIESKFTIGSSDFFSDYDYQREEIETIERSYEIHEYQKFKGKKVLDVGCGNGYVLNFYSKEGAHVHGIDLTKTAIDLTKKRFEMNNLNGEFSVQDAQNLLYEDNYFDCICSMGVLHHVPDTQKAISEIFRVLKPGGRIIVMFYHKNSFKFQWNFRLQSLIYRKKIEQIVNEFDGKTNPKGATYTKEDLLKLLHDFIEIEFSVGYILPSDIIPLSRISDRFLPKNIFKPLEKYFGWNLYAKGFKPYE